MVTIQSAQQLWSISTAMEALANVRLPFRLMLKVRRIRQAIEEVTTSFRQDFQPLVDEVGGQIGPSDEKWPSFVERAEALWSPTEVSLQPITAEELEPLAERADFAFPAALYEVLVYAGIIVE